MVTIDLPALDGVTQEQIEEFYASHMPNGNTFTVRIDGDHVYLTVARKNAAACNILYYSIPDYLSCVS